MARANMWSGREDQRKDILCWVKDNMYGVPNLDRLYYKMVNEGTDGHYVHAYYVRILHDCGRYKITNIEVTEGGHDIDIQLDGWINIQVWHGKNTFMYIIESVLEPDTLKSKAILKHLGGSTEHIPVDDNQDEKKIRSKLAQLPDDTLGILLLHGDQLVWPTVDEEDIPTNKCIINVNGQNSLASILYSSKFNNEKDGRGVADCLGVGLVN